MTRPTFSLTDDEARELLSELAEINLRCDFNPRDHRAFVREFIRGVHRITGKSFSPAIYRRLLTAYAPDRKPSTATLALEKERFVRELERVAPVEPLQQKGSGGGHGTALDIRQMPEAPSLRPAGRESRSTESYLQAQCEFLQQRLSQTEQSLAQARAASSASSARCQVLEAELASTKGQLDSLQANNTALMEQLAALTKAIDETRQFSLLAIDGVRGETRVWRERFLASELQLKEQESLTETFRRLAYRQGADIPPTLRIDRK